MPTDDPNDLPRIDREIRINELMHEAEELAGGEMVHWESPDCPPDMAAEFWERVVAFEKAPWTSSFQQLVEAGVDMPAPEELDDVGLTAKLWEVIGRLADLRVFLYCTDHLSDRELYAELWEEVLHERVKDVPADEDSAWSIDLTSSGSEEDIALYLRYYADEEARRHWQADFPEYQMPPHEDPPYDRDRRLPRPTYERRGGREDGEG